MGHRMRIRHHDSNYRGKQLCHFRRYMASLYKNVAWTYSRHMRLSVASRQAAIRGRFLHECLRYYCYMNDTFYIYRKIFLSIYKILYIMAHYTI